MANLKELRNRIITVKATQKITKAMQMVAASKSRRAQEALKGSRPYAEKMDGLIEKVLAGLPESEALPPVFAEKSEDQTHLLIVCTSERGLCGGFNSSIIRFVKETIADLQKRGKEVKILCVGVKGYDLLRRQYGDLIIDAINFRGVASIGFEQAEEIAKIILKLSEQNAFDRAILFFSKFKTVLTQIPTAKQIIPFYQEEQKDNTEQDNIELYVYEPSSVKILENLLQKNLKTQILGALLENVTSEQGARMSAMDSATRNAGEMIKKQTLLYNRSRQALITNELIEIISGAEAL